MNKVMKITVFLNLLLLIKIEKCLTQETHTFIHPGGWVTVKDIHRIRTKLEAKNESIINAKEAQMKISPDYDYKPQPVEEVIRETGGVGDSDKHLKTDSSHAFTLMINWIATNDSRFGDAAIRVIDGWSEKIKKLVDMTPSWRLVFMAISWHRPQNWPLTMILIGFIRKELKICLKLFSIQLLRMEPTVRMAIGVLLV
jgi:hypothetical protein